jgi:hypothetical protein
MMVFVAFLFACFGAGLFLRQQPRSRPLGYVLVASLLLCLLYFFLQVL